MFTWSDIAVIAVALGVGTFITVLLGNSIRRDRFGRLRAIEIWALRERNEIAQLDLLARLTEAMENPEKVAAIRAELDALRGTSTQAWEDLRVKNLDPKAGSPGEYSRGYHMARKLAKEGKLP